MRNRVQRRNYDEVFEEFQKMDNDIQKFGRILGQGAFGEVREVMIDNKIYAAKLTEKEKSDYIDPESLRGPNIIKIIKISEKKINEKYYDLIIMEKALLKDLGTLTIYLTEKNLLKLINNPFYEICGDSLIRFFTKQIVRGLETLNRCDLIHFDIKPENLLITTGLTIKITDFSFLRHIDTKCKIPGGTNGYISPEYFNKEKISSDVAKKQDYFALGSTIFFLKFCRRMIRYKIIKTHRNENIINIINKTHIIDSLEKSHELIYSNPFIDEEFIKFLCELTECVYERRSNFERIYRNKWLNENRVELSTIVHSFLEGEEDKLIRELVKSNYLITKKRELHKQPKFKFRIN